MFTIGQQITAITSRQVTGKGYRAESTKVMEIASERIFVDHSAWGMGTYYGYKLRKVGGKGKGGSTIWNEADLAAL